MRPKASSLLKKLQVTLDPSIGGGGRRVGQQEAHDCLGEDTAVSDFDEDSTEDDTDEDYLSNETDEEHREEPGGYPTDA